VDPEAEPDAFAFLSTALDAPLPHPWTEHADKKGRIFYWNPASRHSSWQHPLTPSHKSLLASYRRVAQEEDRQAAVAAELQAFQQQVEEEIGRWRQSHAPDGTPYFYKIGTQSTRWDNPRDELMSHMDLRVTMLSELAVQPAPAPAGAADMDATQSLTGPAAADATGFALSGGDAADSGGAALLDATLTSGSGSPKHGGVLALAGEAGQAAEPALSESRSSRWNFLGTLQRLRGRSTERSDGGSSDPGTPLSGSSVRSFLGSMGRKRSQDRRGRPSPKERHRQELAAGMLGRAARRWLAWTRARKYEAALTLQRSIRKLLAIRRLARMRERALQQRAMDERPPLELLSLQERMHEMMTSPQGKLKLSFSRAAMLEPLDDADMSRYIIPDEIALNHGLNFAIPMDRAAFNIIRPLLLRPLPVPWVLLPRQNGRVDFYHSGVREERQRHPLHSFFGEVITFLRAHVHTDVPMAEPLAAQVFREASPQAVRQRLGVWEGPHADLAAGGVCFVRLVPGTDADCAEGDERRDDPRLEAASSVLARLSAWHHLWTGFTPEVPYPFLEGRLEALAAQVAESVVAAPGAASAGLLAQLGGQAPLALLAAPADPGLEPPAREALPLTERERAMQPLVTRMLGRAYGAALACAGRREAEEQGLLRPEEPQAVHEEESEGSYTEIGEEEEYEESFAEEESEAESAPSEKADSLSQDITEATTSAATPVTGRRPMADLDKLMGELAEPEPEEERPTEIASFLPAYNEVNASDWASRGLRPLTPQERKPTVLGPRLPGSPGKRPWTRQRHGFDEHLWTENTTLADSVVRLAVKEPALMRVGALAAEAAGEAGATAETAELSRAEPLSTKLPLSPKDRARAKELLPHLAEPVPPDRLAKVRADQGARADSLSKSLQEATEYFDKCMNEIEEPEFFQVRKKSANEIARFRTGRSDLRKPDIPPAVGEFGAEDNVGVVKGCVARPSTPSKGSLAPPPYLEGAAEPPENGVKPWPPLLRSRSAGASSGKGRTWRSRPHELARPESAEPRARKACAGLLPERTCTAAETAAQSCRRFLSRTCGTVQLALAAFDTSGTGKFNRWEWEQGLRKLGYEESYDVQEIFTVLDKRRHHVLTLSDLLDRYQGVPIEEGQPDRGLSLPGVASEITDEAVSAALDPILTEVLSELLQQALLAPSGPPSGMPDLKRWLRKRDLLRKQKNKKNITLVDGTEQPGSSPRSPKSSTSNRRRRLQGDRSQELAPGTPSSRERSPGRRKKALTKFWAVGQLARRRVRKPAGDDAQGSPPRTPSPTGGRQKGAPGASGSLGRGQSTGSRKLGRATTSTLKASSDGRGSPQRSPSCHDSQSPTSGRGRRTSPKTEAAGAGGTADQTSHKAVASKTIGGKRQKGKRSAEGVPGKDKGSSQRRGVATAKYVGYNFVDRRQDSDEMVAWERENQLPWMPRPTEDICKAYGHIFRLLNDPRTRNNSRGPQKKSVHVSVPRMPPVTSQRRGGDPLDAGPISGGDAPDEDVYDGMGPTPALPTAKRVQGSRSSPDLHHGSSGLSTTGGSWRPSSGRSEASEEDPDRLVVSLPRLTKGSSSRSSPALPARPRVDLERRRRIPI